LEEADMDGYDDGEVENVGGVKKKVGELVNYQSFSFLLLLL
jgi:hypothetical protein